MVVLEANAAPVPFIGEGGWTGTLHPAPAGQDTIGALPRVMVRPSDGGMALLVPAEMVTRQTDGTYFVPLNRTEAESAYALKEATVIPIVEETLTVGKRMVETGKVRITKTVRETEEVVNEPLLREAVSVERVPVNRVVSAPEAARREEGVLIIPLYEETLVVEKRLVLLEELRITIKQSTETSSQTVTLRREEAHVENLPTAGVSSAGQTSDQTNDAR